MKQDEKWQAFTGVCLPLMGVLLGKEPKVMFISLMQEKRNQRGTTPKAPFKEPTEKVQNVKWINSGFR